MTSSERYQNVLNEIKRLAPEREVTLVAVSKGRERNEILEVYQAGCRNFGENRIQEALPKIEALPKDIAWHFIGPLQLNKVTKAVGSFSLIHSVDRFELAEKISQVSVSKGVNTSILLQANTSGEKTKQGLPPSKWKEIFSKVMGLPNLRVQGLMTMAPFVDDEKVIADAFFSLTELRNQLTSQHAPLPILSMGMSHDYPIALEQGATCLRIGSAIFSSLG